MKQVFLFGASIVYGVGGESGGFSSLLKNALHKEMFAQAGLGEVCEVYNFAKPGATVDFVTDNLTTLLDSYKRDGKRIAVVSVGMNNTKAVHEHDNYICSLKDYEHQLKNLLETLKKNFDHVICLGYTPVDESKTNPKRNPLNDSYSFFTNDRIFTFNEVFQNICIDLKIEYLDVLENISIEDWQKHYLYKDGIHPNEKGHKIIFDLLKEKVFTYLTK